MKFLDFESGLDAIRWWDLGALKGRVKMFCTGRNEITFGQSLKVLCVRPVKMWLHNLDTLAIKRLGQFSFHLNLDRQGWLWSSNRACQKWPIDSDRNDPVWLLSLGHKSPWSMCRTYWKRGVRLCLFKSLSPLYEKTDFWNHHAVRKPKPHAFFLICHNSLKKRVMLFISQYSEFEEHFEHYVFFFLDLILAQFSSGMRQ